MVVLAQFIIAVAMFYVVNWIGGHSLHFGYQSLSPFTDVDEAPLFNTVYRIVAPNVLLILIAAGLYAVGQDAILTSSYRIVVFYFVFRWAYVIALGRKLLTRWGRQVAVGVLGTWLAWGLHRHFISVRETFLPRAEELSTELWLIVILFVYHTINHSFTRRSSTNDKHRKRYISAQLAKFRGLYGASIRTLASNHFVEALAYAVLVYESYNRPHIYQWIERRVLSRFRKRQSYGPMQVIADHPLTDRESVERGVTRLREATASALAVLAPFGEYADLLTALKKGGLEELDRRIGEVPQWLMEHLANQVAMWYNVRSDYPSEIAAVFSAMVPSEFPEFEVG